MCITINSISLGLYMYYNIINLLSLLSIITYEIIITIIILLSVEVQHGFHLCMHTNGQS